MRIWALIARIKRTVLSELPKRSDSMNLACNRQSMDSRTINGTGPLLPRPVGAKTARRTLTMHEGKLRHMVFGEP